MTIIGIDLGTTKSTLSIFEDGKAKVIPNQEGDRTTPSIVAKKADGEELVGKLAANQRRKNPKNTLNGIKRLIGRRYFTEDSVREGSPVVTEEVAKMQRLAAFDIVEGSKGDAAVVYGGQTITPPEVGAKILAKLKDAAEKYLGTEVTQAVITVPAYFNDQQREATKAAGAIAGLKVERIINEPTAAALAYGIDKNRGGKYAVFDFGGGTFDISVVEVVADKVAGNMVETLSTNGDTFLGGENFDEAILEWMVAKLNKSNPEIGLDLNNKESKQKHAGTLQGMREAAEKAKIALSSESSTDISVPYITADVHFEETLTRTEFEAMIRPIVEKAIEPCKKSLADAGLTIADIDDVLLVGQSTRVPLVQQVVKEFFGKEPKRDLPLDEIVSMGAAIQGAVMEGKVENIVLVDVIPLSIGIKVGDNEMDIVIGANQTIPFSITKEYSNKEENQPNVAIQLFQGERPRATDNSFLGKLVLDLPTSKLRPVKPGEAEIQVTFNIDENGTLSLLAKDLKSGKVASSTFKANGGLSEDEIARLKQEAEANAEADRKFREDKEVTTKATNSINEAADYTSDPLFAEAPEALRTEFQTVVKELTAARDAKDIEAVKQNLDLYAKATEKLTKHFNTQSAGDTAATNDNSAAPTASSKPASNSPGL